MTTSTRTSDASALFDAALDAAHRLDADLHRAGDNRTAREMAGMMVGETAGHDDAFRTGMLRGLLRALGAERFEQTTRRLLDTYADTEG